MELVRRARQGDVRAIARLISLAENEAPEATAALQELYTHTGSAHVIGVTGPPGSGKSTITDKMVKELRKQGFKVGVLAIDPTSPFTGGAILGDRVRMSDLNLDEGVYIRSMGTRGRLGGLSKATNYAVKILDACGYDYIFIETVGVGQSEVDIVKTAETVILIMVPGLGDDIQAIKAGILEIGDIFVVNKSDRDGANRVVIELEMMLGLNPEKKAWIPPILMTVADQNKGVSEVVREVQKHHKHLNDTGEMRKRNRGRLEGEVMDLLLNKMINYVNDKINSTGEFQKEIDRILGRETDPYTLVEKIFNESVK